jgi:hypothetical protein
LFNVTGCCKVVRYSAWMRGVDPRWLGSPVPDEASFEHRRSGATRTPGPAGRGPEGVGHGRGLRGLGAGGLSAHEWIPGHPARSAGACLRPGGLGRSSATFTEAHEGPQEPWHRRRVPRLPGRGLAMRL